MKLADTLRIAAAPATVWAVTTDLEHWPEWTPTVERAALVTPGALRLGSVARLKQPAQPEAEWTVTEFVPGERFTWASQRTGMAFVATHEITLEDGGTRHTLRVEASGWLATLLSPILRPAIRRALRQENDGLRRRCEALAQAQR